jgi:hypothetical protein
MIPVELENEDRLLTPALVLESNSNSSITTNLNAVYLEYIHQVGRITIIKPMLAVGCAFTFLYNELKYCKDHPLEARPGEVIALQAALSGAVKGKYKIMRRMLRGYAEEIQLDSYGDEKVIEEGHSLYRVAQSIPYFT